MTSPRNETSPDVARASRRTRLRPEERRQQILDAALAEFSMTGFEGATMDRIALRTGLTKAGLYAHFKSKEQILEDLLVSGIFNASFRPHWQWAPGASLEEVIDCYLDKLYGLLQEPQFQATLRLLITESGRSPERIHRWSEEIFRPHAEQRQGELDACVNNGLMADNAISRNSSLVAAPALMAMLSYWLLGSKEAEQEVAQIRAGHREMLLKTLSRESAK